MAKKKSKNADAKKSQNPKTKKDQENVEKTDVQEERTEAATNEPQTSTSDVLNDGGSEEASTSGNWEKTPFQPRSSRYPDDQSGSSKRNYTDVDRNANIHRRDYSRKSEPFKRKESHGDRRECPNKEDNWRQSSSGSNDKLDRRRPFVEENDDYAKFRNEFNKTTNPNYVKTIEIEGDLFKMSEEYSLAHCVAEDMSMGSGIAVQFRHDFKRVDELLNQRVKTGGLAVLKHGDRYIYYLVTKRFSTGKPTYKTLWSSLLELRQHVIENEVTKLAMPRIGCGLDRLQWDEVKFMIESVFKNVEIDIKICNLQMSDDTPQQRHRSLRLTNESYPIEKIEEKTVIIYLSSEDEYISDEMKALDEKFHFLREFTFAKKLIGNVIFFTKDKNYLLCGCIVKKRTTDDINFTAFVKCLRLVQKENLKWNFYYIAMQAFRDKNDPTVMFKIINILRNTMRDVDVYICWPGDLQDDLLAKDSYNSYKPSSEWDNKRRTMDPQMLRKDTKYEKKDTPMETSDTNDWFDMGAKQKDVHNTSLSTGMNLLDVDDQEKNSWSEEDEEKEQTQQKGNEERHQNWNQSKNSERSFENSQSCKKQKQFHQTSDNGESQEFEKYEREKNQIVLRKVKQQLLPKKYSRVCYAREDMVIESRISKGSDVTQFIGELLNQNEKEGGCAFVKDNTEYLYCPIIKGPLTVPSGCTIFSSLQRLRDHVKKNNTKNLVIPKIDDDDSFKWSDLASMIEFLFKDVATNIILDPTPEDHNIKITKDRLKNVKFTINNMRKKSILIYLTSIDGKFTKSMDNLKTKYEFDAKIDKKNNLGKVIKYKENEDHVIYGCVVRKAFNDSVNFRALQRCLNDINQKNWNDEKLTAAYLQIEEDLKSNVNFKLVTLLLTCLSECTIFLGWPGDFYKKIPTNYP